MYNQIEQGFEILRGSEINLMIISSRPGLGKSHCVNELIKTDENSIVFGGYVSESKFYEFLYENSDKLIVFRDCSNLLKNHRFLDFIKIASEVHKEREISRLIHRREGDPTPNKFTFTGKLILELNSLPHKHSDDIEAIKSRSLNVEIILNPDEINSLMREIAKTDKQKEVTEYLISKEIAVNLRTQQICFEMAKLDDWKEKVDLFIHNSLTEIQKALYEKAGVNRIPRKTFVRHLIERFNWSKSTCERRVKDSIELEDITGVGLRNSMISL